MTLYLPPARPEQTWGSIFDDEDDHRPPRATIVEPSVWPQRIPAGGSLRCVAQIESDSGPADRFIWVLDDQVRVRNPASDVDHTFRALSPGLHRIELRVEGPGGTSKTTRRREVLVEAAAPQPEPEPEPPPVKGTRTELGSAHGAFLRVNPDGSVDARGAARGPWEQIEIVEVQP